MALRELHPARDITGQFEKLEGIFRSATLFGGSRSDGTEVYGYEHAARVDFEFTYGSMAGKAGDFIVRITIPDWGDEPGYRIVSREKEPREHERLAQRRIVTKRIRLTAHLGVNPRY